jgi:hypothetical protein
MRWEDLYTIVEGLNPRGEPVFDVYVKDTDNMMWANIPVDDIEEFMKGVLSIIEKVAEEEFDKMFEQE